MIRTMNRRLLALAVVLGCTPPHVDAFFAAQRREIRDPEAVADLRAIGAYPACIGRCDDAGDFTTLAKRAYGTRQLEEAGRLAACITQVATYKPPTPSDIVVHLTNYRLFGDLDRFDDESQTQDLCALRDGSVKRPELVPMFTKYYARTTAQRAHTVAAKLEAELVKDIAGARASRDANLGVFGDELAYCDTKLALIRRLSGEPAFVAREDAELAALRFGVYGPVAMQAAFERDLIVVAARTERAAVAPELDVLLTAEKRSSTMTDSDRARERDLQGTVDRADAAIASRRRGYAIDEATAREQRWTNDPEVKQIRDRVALVDKEIGALFRRRDAMVSTLPHCDDDPKSERCVGDSARAKALETEHNVLRARLVELRSRYEITWPLDSVVEYR
jgi:hypothetical protein